MKREIDHIGAEPEDCLFDTRTLKIITKQDSTLYIIVLYFQRMGGRGGASNI